jgi:hypothetical protein
MPEYPDGFPGGVPSISLVPAPLAVELPQHVPVSYYIDKRLYYTFLVRQLENQLGFPPTAGFPLPESLALQFDTLVAQSTSPTSIQSLSSVQEVAGSSKELRVHSKIAR